MSFTSLRFLIFFAVLLCAYYLLPRSWQWKLLLCASYLFYAFAGWQAVGYLLLTTFTTWLSAVRIGGAYDAQAAWLAGNKGRADREARRVYKASVKARARRWMLFGVLLNFGALGVVKYADFLLGNVNFLLSLFSSARLPLPNLLLPMGISFYIFQSMGYLLDVYRAKYPPEKSLGKTALFISFFPQLIQGPISRFDQLAPTLLSGHRWDARGVALGLQRMLWGYFKKLVVADRLMPAVSALSGSPEEYQGTYVLVLMVVYAVTLYADFTGGIDITIGAAQALGVEVTENFQRPFFSKNTAEYWRRWHITMGAWFRDYIFYPLSVTKPMLRLTQRCKARFGMGVAKRISVYLVTLVTWFVTGIWHGASWNFIVWGVLNGVIILVSQELNPLYARFHRRCPRLGDTFGYRLFQVCRTFLLMSAVRVLDCYRDVPVTFRAVGSVFTSFHPSVLWNGSLLGLGLTGWDWLAAGCGTAVMLAVSLLSRDRPLRAKLEEKPLAVRWTVFGALFLAVVIFGAYGVGYDQNQFIYNQF